MSDEMIRMRETVLAAAEAFFDAVGRGNRDEALRHKRRATLALDRAAIEMWREEVGNG